MAEGRADRDSCEMLERCWPFNTIPRMVRDQLAQRVSGRHFHQGEFLMRQGEIGDCLMVLLDGIVEVRLRADGKEDQVITRLGSSEIVGEMALFTKEPRTADVQAVTPVETLVLSEGAFEDLAKEHPILCVLLSELMSKRLGQLRLDGMCSKTLKDYVIQRPLGRGGMAVVYEAVDERSGSRCALKMLNHCLLYNHAAFQRFERERDIVRSLHHDNIVRVDRFFPAYKTYFMVMEFCDGADLSSVLRLRTSGLPEDQVRSILGQLAKALQHAHENGIVHRDLKPSNVMLSRDGVIKLMDFGVARPVIDSTLTGSDAILGTPAYMAPEHRAGQPVDERADHYSFGVTAFELLHGPLNISASSSDLFGATAPPALRFSQIRRDLSDDLKDLLQGCLRGDPEARVLDLARVAEWAGEVDSSLLLRGIDETVTEDGPTVTVALERPDLD